MGGGAMSRLYVSKLDKDMRERIETARYTEMELEGIRGILQRTIDARMKAARGVIILFVVMDAFAAWAEVFANPNPSAEAFAVSMGALIAIEVLTWWLVWNLQIGILKRSFNRAVVRGYPQLPHCRLRWGHDRARHGPATGGGGNVRGCFRKCRW